MTKSLTYPRDHQNVPAHRRSRLAPAFVPEVKPTSPAAAIVLVLLFIVCFIIGLWVLMALTRIVLG